MSWTKDVPVLGAPTWRSTRRVTGYLSGASSAGRPSRPARGCVLGRRCRAAGGRSGSGRPVRRAQRSQRRRIASAVDAACSRAQPIEAGGGASEVAECAGRGRLVRAWPPGSWPARATRPGPWVSAVSRFSRRSRSDTAASPCSWISAGRGPQHLGRQGRGLLGAAGHDDVHLLAGVGRSRRGDAGHVDRRRAADRRPRRDATRCSTSGSRRRGPRRPSTRPSSPPPVGR